MVQTTPGVGRPAWLALAVGGPVLEAATAAGSRARVVGSPSELIDALERDRPRLVVLSSPPAGRAELELVATLKRRRPGLRSILVDHPESSQERIDALELGFDEALPDTIPATEIAERVALLVRRQVPTSGRVIELGDHAELDLTAHELRRDGRSVHLRPTEYRLLALLAANPGRAFTRRQLLDRVWGPGRAVDSRTVDVHVAWLRSKIEDHPGRPTCLVTVRGMGYRLDPPRPLTG
jgi:two-component system OmpR family response regulator/two-component system alkaline phosphatase synthesis response regulator PhoP